MNSLSRVQIFATPWTAAYQPPPSMGFPRQEYWSGVPVPSLPWTASHQISMSITNFWSLLRLMSIELMMPSNHLILCCPLLLLPSVFPSIRVFSNEAKVLEFQLHHNHRKEINFRLTLEIKYIKSFRVVKDSRGNLKLLIFQMKLLKLTESEKFGLG